MIPKSLIWVARSQIPKWLDFSIHMMHILFRNEVSTPEKNWTIPEWLRCPYNNTMPHTTYFTNCNEVWYVGYKNIIGVIGHQQRSHTVAFNVAPYSFAKVVDIRFHMHYSRPSFGNSTLAFLLLIFYCPTNEQLLVRNSSWLLPWQEWRFNMAANYC